ncbi:MAG: 5-formyltetrahydrofolate cyclo-ligase [Actinomycetota bacterium]|nr:5-formyltetrahydrofolate cyclo-ligase [Actinomycetota bacterium]
MTGQGDGVARAKEDLRVRMRVVRSRIPVGERATRAASARRRLLDLPEVRAARVTLLFYSFGSEIATSDLLLDLLAAPKRLLLPYLDAGTMEAAEVRPGDVLAHSDYGPREPSIRDPVSPDVVDLVIAPGLAFDRQGYRLGYGGGHYDRYLARVRADCIRVGIGFAEQVVPVVPAEPADQRLDLVVTDREVIRREA